MLLKGRGPQTAADLGKALGTTGENARQQLTKLAGDGVVVAQSETRGVGRPTQVWQLTDTGHARFPDTHAELTVQLLRAVRETFGAYALDRLIDAREDDMLKVYRQELEGAADIKEKVSRLARIRSREGYMAEWRENDDHSLLLIENHCPICAAAATCQGFCRSELDVFQTALGPTVQIERVEHILTGARRCAYRIQPKEPPAAEQA
jgi:predicted ArsR family transcriptional regulator